MLCQAFQEVTFRFVQNFFEFLFGVALVGFERYTLLLKTESSRWHSSALAFFEEVQLGLGVVVSGGTDFDVLSVLQ